MLIVHVDGGLVQNIYSMEPDNSQILIVDTDTEGADPDELIHALDDNGKEMTAFIHKEKVIPMPENCEIHRFVKAYDLLISKSQILNERSH